MGAPPPPRDCERPRLNEFLHDRVISGEALEPTIAERYARLSPTWPTIHCSPITARAVTVVPIPACSGSSRAASLIVLLALWTASAILSPGPEADPGEVRLS